MGSNPTPSAFFERTAVGTAVTASVSLSPGGVFRLAAPLLVGSLRRQVAANLPVLKELLERQATRIASSA